MSIIRGKETFTKRSASAFLVSEDAMKIRKRTLEREAKHKRNTSPVLDHKKSFFVDNRK